MTNDERPEVSEAPEYYFRSINLVPAGPVCDTLAAQHEDTYRLLNGISESASLERYAPGKWSIRQVVGHLVDAERLFVFRAFWFARGFGTDLPSFYQERISRHVAAACRHPCVTLAVNGCEVPRAPRACHRAGPDALQRRSSAPPVTHM